MEWDEQPEGVGTRRTLAQLLEPVAAELSSPPDVSRHQRPAYGPRIALWLLGGGTIASVLLAMLL